MRRSLLVLLAALTLRAGIPAFAHHSFTSTYDVDKTVKIEGKIVGFQFRNPHSFLQIEAPDANGVIQRWAIEWGGAGSLGAQGVTRNSLKIGDVVIITGNPGRTAADHRIRMLTLLRPSDEFGWGGAPGEVVD
jgi:hypothetical protein